MSATDFSTRLAQHLAVDLVNAGHTDIDVPNPIHVNELHELCTLLGVNVADYVSKVENHEDLTTIRRSTSLRWHE